MGVKPSRVLVCFDAHRADGKVWSIRTKGQWIDVAEVLMDVPLLSVYRGRTARQPRAYFQGIGVVRLSRSGEAATIAAD